MKKYNWIILISALLLATAIVFHALSNRFYIDSTTKLIVDRLTGDTKTISKETTTPTPLTRSKYYVTESQAKNIEMLIASETMMPLFSAYYDSCINNIKINPLFYSRSGTNEDTIFWDEFKRYASFVLSPSQIQEAYNGEGIDNALDYLNMVLKHQEDS